MSMEFVETVARLIESRSLGIQGRDLFIYNMPEQVETGILLLMDSQTPTEIDDEIPKLRRTHFKAIVRGTDYRETLALANGLRDELNLHRLTLGDYEIIRLRPTYDPIPFPVPNSDLIEVVVNFWSAYIEP
jgi:hypothetical protein